MERFGRARLWRWAAVLSVVVALMGLIGYDVPSLIDGADASPDPYWLVIGSFASDVVALIAAYGTWQRQRWGVVLLIVANVYWMVQVVGTLFDPVDGADVAFALVMGVVHVFTLWCVLRHEPRAVVRGEPVGSARG
jgi:hypothetical protein